MAGAMLNAKTNAAMPRARYPRQSTEDDDEVEPVVRLGMVRDGVVEGVYWDTWTYPMDLSPRMLCQVLVVISSILWVDLLIALESSFHFFLFAFWYTCQCHFDVCRIGILVKGNCHCAIVICSRA